MLQVRSGSERLEGSAPATAPGRIPLNRRKIVIQRHPQQVWRPQRRFIARSAERMHRQHRPEKSGPHRISAPPSSLTHRCNDCSYSWVLNGYAIDHCSSIPVAIFRQLDFASFPFSNTQPSDHRHRRFRNDQHPEQRNTGARSTLPILPCTNKRNNHDPPILRLPQHAEP